MIKQLTLGHKTFPNNIIQGPLAGVSCAPFRSLTWRYSQPAFSCTEMISCKTLLHQPFTSQKRFIAKSLDEGPVCFQLSSNEPKELAEASKKVTDFGADLIDLNCGCPKKKMRSKGVGSSLLKDPSKLYQLIYSLKRNTHLPVSIKIRVDGTTDNFNAEIAKVVSEAGTDFLIVHGRHWSEQYESPCRYNEIQFFVDQLKIPVIGNGDIACKESLKQMFATGCAGVMIARAGVGQPWLIRQLIAETNEEQYNEPFSTEVGLIFIEHIEMLQELLNSEKFAILQARKLAKYYARKLPTKAEFCASINICETIQDFKAICLKNFFQS